MEDQPRFLLQQEAILIRMVFTAVPLFLSLISIFLTLLSRSHTDRASFSENSSVLGDSVSVAKGR